MRRRRRRRSQVSVDEEEEKMDVEHSASEEEVCFKAAQTFILKNVE